MNAGVPGLGVCSEAVAHLFRVSQSNNTQVSSWLLLAFCLRSLASSCFNLPPFRARDRRSAAVALMLFSFTYLHSSNSDSPARMALV